MTITITCPICGERSGYEFKFGGEDRGPKPKVHKATPKEWCDYIHMRKNIGGIQKEWWYHQGGCGIWFTIHRDTLSNQEVKAFQEKTGDNEAATPIAEEDA